LLVVDAGRPDLIERFLECMRDVIGRAVADVEYDAFGG